MYIEPAPEHKRALDRAKIALINQPSTVFYCEIVFSLKTRWTRIIPTAATNGVELLINPEFFMGLDEEERVGLLVHEAMHLAYMHNVRRGDREPRLYNMAGDYVINLLIVRSKIKLPPQGLYDTQYEGLNTEQVYDLLVQQKQNPNSPVNQPGDIPGTGDDLIDLPAGMTGEQVKEHIEETLIRASLRSQEEEDQPGTIPGDIQLMLDRLLKPKLPWNRILQKYLNKFNKSDYSFRKPNRRFQPEHYLPSFYSTTLTDLAIGVDISGSVSDREFTAIVSEVASIFRTMKPEKITLIQFDTRIIHINEVKNIQELVKIDFNGRGGTDIGELIYWANNKKPQLLLVFTDGEFRFKHYKSKCDVLWLIHNNKAFKPAFGKAIHYGINN